MACECVLVARGSTSFVNAVSPTPSVDLTTDIARKQEMFDVTGVFGCDRSNQRDASIQIDTAGHQ